MEQVTRAVGFKDLNQLIKDTGKILKGLSHVPVKDQKISVSFYWAPKGRDYSVKIKSESSEQTYGFKVPKGVSVADWVDTVSSHLVNHLRDGKWFFIQDDECSYGNTHTMLSLMRA